jgi:hypothetical protein
LGIEFSARFISGNYRNREEDYITNLLGEEEEESLFPIMGPL